MTDRTARLSFFLLGIGLPLLGWALWSKSTRQRIKELADDAHDSTVEDSFPASDPPSAW